MRILFNGKENMAMVKFRNENISKRFLVVDSPCIVKDLQEASPLFKFSDAKRYKMVAYWGQNGVYAIHKERERWEKELDYFCKSHSYDVVVLAFNHIFFDRRNKGESSNFVMNRM